MKHQREIHIALVALNHLLADVEQQWLLIGSASLMLLGFDVVPHDIDILTDAATAQLIAQKLKPFAVAVELKDSHKFRSVFSRYTIAGVSVELMGDLEVRTEQGWLKLNTLITQPETVFVDDNPILVPSIAEQMAIYQLFDREKDRLIKEMLLKRN